MVNLLNVFKNYAKTLDNTKIIILYRYFSLVITSVFYLVISDNSIATKLFVLTCIIVSSQIIMQLYVKSFTNPNILKFLTIIESLGIILILIPTGGLSSPYIWYAVNTILISSFFLPLIYTWINLLLYLILTILISHSILNPKPELRSFVLSHSNLILSFILITVVFLLLSRINKILNNKSIELTKLNSELECINRRSSESMDYIMALYQAIHSLSIHHCKEKTIRLLMTYIKKITKSSTILFYHNESKDLIHYGLDNLTEKEHNAVKEKLNKFFRVVEKSTSPVNMNIIDHEYILIIVRTSYKTYGVLGVENNQSDSDLFYRENVKQLKFLSDLSSIILEKLYLEEVNERMLIDEEQNRIANEIHDSVCQRLFAISCSTHALQVNRDRMTPSEYNETINDIKIALKKAMKELRSIIYKLSWNNQDEDSFEVDIRNYINDISKLHDVNIKFVMNEHHELLHYDLKKGLYRLICEGTGNAIRHGKAKDINIKITIKQEIITLVIKDNGEGFNINTIHNGLGLKNIYNIVYSLNGQVNINSGEGEGTRIKAIFKKGNVALKENLA